MLLRQIERFLRQTDMPWTKFGRLAAQDVERRAKLTPLAG